MKTFLIQMWIASLCVTLLGAQAQQTVQCSGSASISGQPDQVKVDIGVTTTANTAQDASAQNATQMTAVLAQIRQVLGTLLLGTSWRMERIGQQQET